MWAHYVRCLTKHCSLILPPHAVTIRHYVYNVILTFFDIFQANSSNKEALLKHAQEENHFYSFSSYLYPTDSTHVTRKWLLAIGSKGRMRNASRVQPGHKSHQFQITEIRKKTKTNDISTLFHRKVSKGK